MKVNPWLLPVAALLITGAWIVAGKRSATTLEREITVLTERIELTRSVGGGAGETGETGGKYGKNDDGTINWKDVAGKVAQARGSNGPGDIRTYMRLQQLLLDMSAEELGAQINEIAALGIEDSTRLQLRGMILGVLADKDPKMVLEQFSDELGDEESGGQWHLRSALGKWAEEDPVAAASWLDSQIAAGKFESKSLDGKNQNLLRMEAAVVGHLLKSDPAAATARVTALPENQREDFFRQGFYGATGKDTEAALAQLIRDSLPSEKVGKVLAEKADNFSMQGGYERVDGFIANANATDEEKSTIVLSVMENKLSQQGDGKIKEEELEKARAWGATQSPGAVDKATGEALGNTLWRGAEFEEASAMTLKYNESSPNDEVLVAFLKSSAVRNRSAEQAMALIDQIKDPDQREEILALKQYKNQSTEP